ncbi:TonB-dependent receptor [Shewanella sp. 1_MG-2023]|uniref:TonB-dependent receptor plug domain-containing protein n=1 Tax=unclassified Shewanella TaxID=196818 RepID=UPI000C84EC1F|nr:MULTISPECIES: TonB-dependent receptor [unclassified Shewanella]MCC4831351.1 TonB-dependent receptor [Shewanella sp. 10N.7]MDO6609873.1 TonB-dependent receptor [Shewanella sp. 7_MG-2023]MDO6769985.1 TonB-dependent receptor [Shewanella sp. 2_MG-2023]MDO6793049.1 TonB-dependent receptor [Shewanella sp. 1_MG-2023]PMG70576.1 TonB-dependent receptor [Shewanella sp. 10N.286.51.B7]
MMTNLKKRKFGLNSLSLAVTVALAGSVMSTQAMAEDEEVAENVEKIAVVGSRAAPRSVGESPVPVDIISADDLRKNGSTDMIDMLVTSVPSFNSRAQPISDAATLVRPVNLRGLPSDSTLILVNGKRRHRASVIAFQGGGINDGAQGPDISVIPSIALKQVEVLRDGAAAQYGSDAIAGVMNFQLKDSAEGGSISVSHGEYYEGDGATTTVDGNIGLPLTDAGFVNISAQYKTADATSRSVQRPDAAGLIAGGNTFVNDPAQVWGNPEINDDYTIFANLGFDFNDKHRVYAFGNVSSREAIGGFYYRNPHNRGNVYSVDGGETLLVGAVNGDQSTCDVVPANVPNVLDTPEYAAMVADPNCFSMNQVRPGGYTPQFAGTIEDMSFFFGFEGEMGEWNYDASAGTGSNKSSFSLYNSLNPSLGLAANPEDTQTDFDTGAYEQVETTVNLDFSRFFTLGSVEDISFATGFEWREESFEITQGEEASWIAGPYADQGFNIGSHGFKGFGPEAAGKNDRSNIGIYADVEAYLTDDWLLGVALRYEDFSTFGDTLNYKISTQYSFTDYWSMRASHSTGFRAPTVGQENVVNTQTSIVNGDLIQTFIAPPTDPLAAFYGGEVLEPEESVNYAIGTVFEYEDFFLTVDYYNIEVTGRIAQSSQIEVKAEDYDDLRDAGVEFPELISAVTYYTNDFDTTTQGVDIVGSYETELMSGDTMFSLAYGWTDTNVDKFDPDTTDEGKVRRLEDGIPAHRATLTWNQTWDDLNVSLRGNYFGEYYATHADDTSDWGSETADSAVTVDLEVSYTMFDQLTLSVGANNLFDQEAQELKDGTQGVLGAVYYESGPFDYNGGFYYGKVSYVF